MHAIRYSRTIHTIRIRTLPDRSRMLRLKGIKTPAIRRNRQGGRRAFVTYAFPTEHAVAVNAFPVSYYDLLSVQRSGRREDVLRAFRNLAAKSGLPPYSSDTLHTRACILDMAASTLLDLDLRRWDEVREALVLIMPHTWHPCVTYTGPMMKGPKCLPSMLDYKFHMRRHLVCWPYFR